jgi:GAF domain-containing protein
MLENAVRICDAKFGNIYRWDGELFHFLAAFNTPHALVDARTHSPFRPARAMRHMVESKMTVHVADLAAHEDYTEGHHKPVSEVVELAGVRTFLAVPMLKDNDLIGAFSLFRQIVRPFTDKQIELVQNFAAQAVVAIENARLLNELRQRTDDLTESLEQRTATSEVLGVISSSPGELAPVFDTILANALRLCDADMGHVYRAQAGALQVAAMRGGRPEFAESLRERGPWQPGPHGAPVEAMDKKKPVQIADLSQTAGYVR